MRLKKRESYWQEIKDIPVKNLIFLDESGATLQIFPRYGRAYGGARAKAHVPYQRGNHITIIGAISLTQVEAAMYGQWSANGDIFCEFLEQYLSPNLTPDKVVIMDNVSFHKTGQAYEIINKTGAKTVYLPPYHPELNPIEEMWSKIKTILRQQAARTLSKFQNAIQLAFNAISISDLMGWFQHAGY